MKVYQAVRWGAAAGVGVWVRVPIAIQTLVILMAIDYASGIIAAMINGQLSSAKGWRGFARKVLVLLLVMAAHHAALPLNLTVDLASVIATGFAINELVSIVENCAFAGLSLPGSLLRILLHARDVVAEEKAPKKK